MAHKLTMKYQKTYLRSNENASNKSFSLCSQHRGYNICKVFIDTYRYR